MSSVASQTPPPSNRRIHFGNAGRPRITLNIPQPGQQAFHNYYNPAVSPYINTGLSNPSQFGGGAPQWPPSTPYVNPFTPQPYPNAGEISSMFQQFEGLKEWTKSGLNMGEKSAFYIYEKFSRWSRKWFTHIFLLTIVSLYSVAGAFIFMAIEGTCLFRFKCNVTHKIKFK